jgi:hypothetical protein
MRGSMGYGPMVIHRRAGKLLQTTGYVSGSIGQRPISTIDVAKFPTMVAVM